VQNVKEITPQRPQLKPGPGDIEAQGADDASVISILAGAVVFAPLRMFLQLLLLPQLLLSLLLLPCSHGPLLSVTLSLSFPFRQDQNIEAAALSPWPSVIWYLASGPIKLDGAA
jgi:hypothetical protein